MGLVGLLRVLRRRRIAVAVGALLAIAVGALAILRGGDTGSAASSLTRVLVDTPKSLVADAQAQGAGTINTRARLVGGLMADDQAKAMVAQKAGLQSSQLAILGPGAAAPPDVITPLAQQAVEAAKPTQPDVVSIEVSPGLPILSVTANAPDRAQAAKLGAAATATLSSVAQGAPGGGSTLSVEQVGAPQVGAKASGGGKTKAVASALVLFILWCLGVVVFDGAARRRRARRAEWPDGYGAAV